MEVKTGKKGRKGMFFTPIWRAEKMNRERKRGAERIFQSDRIINLVKAVGGSEPERSFPCFSWDGFGVTG